MKIWMRCRRRAVGLVWMLCLLRCGPGPNTSSAEHSAAAVEWTGPGANPCLAHNPIPLIGPLSLDEIDKAHGEGHGWGLVKKTDLLTDGLFALPIEANVCVSVTARDLQPNDVARLTVQVDGNRFKFDLLRPERGAGRGVAVNASVPLHLTAGPHSVSILKERIDQTVIDFSILAQGPSVLAFSPIIAATGARVTLTGEGLTPTSTIDIAGRPYPVESISASGDTAVVRVPEWAPIGPFHVVSPLGSGVSSGVFNPLTPRGAFPIYFVTDFAIPDDGSCVAPKRFRLAQDGGRVSFIVDLYRPPPADFSLQLLVDNDNDPDTVELPITFHQQPAAGSLSGAADLLAAAEGTTVVVSASFGALDLHSLVSFGWMAVHLEMSSTCGTSAFPSGGSPGTREFFTEFRSIFAPGVLLVRSTIPQQVATRHGLQFLAKDATSDLSAMGIPPGRRLEDVMVELALDTDTQGSFPDPVMYPGSHRNPGSTLCGDTTTTARDQVFDSFAGPFPPETGGMPLSAQSQWPLSEIGLTTAPGSHPSAVGGKGVMVAVIDSGVSPHPDLAQNLSASGADVVYFGDGSTTDIDGVNSGHGTSVASIIAAAQGNGGMVGIAPAARILPIRASDRAGLMDGFGIYRAFGFVLGYQAAHPFPGCLSEPDACAKLQVVNVSSAEFADTILIGAGALATLAGAIGNGLVFVPNGTPVPLDVLGTAVLIAGVIVNKQLHDRAGGVINSGMALVVSAGNSGPGGTYAALAPFGMQYPANVNGAFAVASIDSLGVVAGFSTPALSHQHIALAAPTEQSGGTMGGVKAAVGVPLMPTAYQCFGGTSAAAPMVSGAAALLLSPSGSGSTTLTKGIEAAAQLVATARPLAQPSNRVGVGELDLGVALSTRDFSWSIDFDTTSGFISDFAFLPGVGDFALRLPGTTIETMPAPGGTVTALPTLATAQTWMVGLTDTRQLIVGNGTTLTLLTSAGAVVGTLPGVATRAAVSRSVAGFADASQLVAFVDAVTGAVIIRNGSTLLAGPNLAVLFAQSGEFFIDAQWADTPNRSDYILAVRTATKIEYYRVTGSASSLNGCRTHTGDCPELIGRSDTRMIVGSVLDWALTVDATGPMTHFVDGSSTIYVSRMGPIGTPSTITTIPGAGTTSYVTIAANPKREFVYAADERNCVFLMLSGTRVLSRDVTNCQLGPYSIQFPLRVAPTGDYGYVSSPFSFRLQPTDPFRHRALFISNLGP